MPVIIKPGVIIFLYVFKKEAIKNAKSLLKFPEKNNQKSIDYLNILNDCPSPIVDIS